VATLVVLDASALVKRYIVESGSETVNRLFDRVEPRRMSCLMLGAGEVASVLVRRRNAGHITPEAYAAAHDALLREVILAPEFATLPALNEDVLGALRFLVEGDIVC
jgi:predicted nucleic acid-binding protein